MSQSSLQYYKQDPEESCNYILGILPIQQTMEMLQLLNSSLDSRKF